MRMSEADGRREGRARAMDLALAGTGIEVVAGGKKGPYTPVVARLNEREVRRLAAEVAAILGRTDRRMR